MYWSVHQYHRPMMGAQISIPNQGKAPLKYHACLVNAPALLYSITGCQEDSTPGGFNGLPQVNNARAATPAQFPPAAELMQAINGQAGRAGNQNEDLDRIVV